MALINENFLKLKAGYLFPEIGRRVRAYKQANSDKKVISLGIGDVTQPLPDTIINAMKQAADEMATFDGFHGYGPEQGYEFLRQTIVDNGFGTRGVRLDADEVFVRGGGK